MAITTDRKPVKNHLPPLNKTVVRAGFGVFTNQAAYSVLQNLAENIPCFLIYPARSIFGASNFAAISSALDPREMQLALKLIFWLWQKIATRSIRVIFSRDRESKWELRLGPGVCLAPFFSRPRFRVALGERKKLC